MRPPLTVTTPAPIGDPAGIVVRVLVQRPRGPWRALAALITAAAVIAAVHAAHLF